MAFMNRHYSLVVVPLILFTIFHSSQMKECFCENHPDDTAISCAEPSHSNPKAVKNDVTQIQVGEPDGCISLTLEPANIQRTGNLYPFHHSQKSTKGLTAAFLIHTPPAVIQTIKTFNQNSGPPELTLISLRSIRLTC